MNLRLFLALGLAACAGPANAPAPPPDVVPPWVLVRQQAVWGAPVSHYILPDGRSLVWTQEATAVVVTAWFERGSQADGPSVGLTAQILAEKSRPGEFYPLGGVTPKRSYLGILAPQGEEPGALLTRFAQSLTAAPDPGQLKKIREVLGRPPNNPSQFMAYLEAGIWSDKDPMVAPLPSLGDLRGIWDSFDFPELWVVASPDPEPILEALTRLPPRNRPAPPVAPQNLRPPADRVLSLPGPPMVLAYWRLAPTGHAGLWAEYLGQPGGALERVLVPDWARAAWVRAEEDSLTLLLELQPSRSATAALAQIPPQVPNDALSVAAERWRLRRWARWALPETRVAVVAESFFRSGLADLRIDSNFVAPRLDVPVRVEARP